MSNCFIWAVWQYLTKGGYIIMRQANSPKWLPHFLWSPDLHEFWQFSPIGKRGLLFRGEVKEAHPVADKWIDGFMAGVEMVAGSRKEVNNA